MLYCGHIELLVPNPLSPLPMLFPGAGFTSCCYHCSGCSGFFFIWLTQLTLSFPLGNLPYRFQVKHSSALPLDHIWLCFRTSPDIIKIICYVYLSDKTTLLEDKNHVLVIFDHLPSTSQRLVPRSCLINVC